MPDLAQLLKVPQVDRTLPFDISPDGTTAIFSWNKSGTWELWTLALDGDPSSNPVLVSTGLDGSKFNPRFSADGLQAAFALDPDGSEAFQICVHDLDTHATVNLTPDIAHAYRPKFSWSPDGKNLAVISDMKGQFAAYLLPLNGDPVRLLKNVFHPCRDAIWSPDGQWIALESEAPAGKTNIFLIPINRPYKGPKARTIQVSLDDKPVNAGQPAWSPDSKQLAFSMLDVEWRKIALLDIETQQMTWLTEGSGDDLQPAWSQDGTSLAWVHSEGAATRIKVRRESGQIEEQWIGKGVHAFPKFTPQGLAILYEDPQHPCDLWSLQDQKTFNQLTRSLSQDSEQMDSQAPIEICYPSLDGIQVPALLYQAQNSKGAVILIHDGPNQHMQFTWQPLIHHLVLRGYTVLAPNYRGSSGYGNKWREASRYNMGGVDMEDCCAAADFLLEHGLAQPGRIAISGRGHGGYLTMACLTQHPSLFAAGSAAAPFVNWLKLHKRSRDDFQYWNIESMGYPEEFQDLWRERSPYFFLDKITPPVQLIHGGRDGRYPVSESQDAHDTLVKLGKKVDLHIYPHEGHAFSRIETVIDAELKRMDFLIRALEGLNETTTSSKP